MLTVLAAAVLYGCSSSPAPAVGSGSGSGGAGGGLVPDAGMAPPDAGMMPPDAGMMPDSSMPPDSGMMPPDAGEPDGSSPDASVPPVVSAPAIACADAVADVYVTPANLPPMTLAARGDLVRCAPDAKLTLTDVSSQVMAKGITTPMTTGVNLFRVAFRTERGDDSPGVSTARVYLPSTPQSLPLPVIVIGHPTSGLAPSCTPSLDASSNQDLALPWAGLGYAVIVPDYAGLGNEGVQSYLDNHDQGHAVLDGARALRKLLPDGAFSSSVLAVGYSQGGGAVLSAQALAPSYGVDGTLAGVIVFAPQWPTRLNSFGYVDELNDPAKLTIATGISQNVVTVMMTYGYFYNRVGPTHATDGFPAASRSGIDNAVKTLCQVPLGGYLQITAPKVGDLFDPTLRTTLLACIAGKGQGPDCVDPGQSFYNYLTQNLLTGDPNGPPMLFVQGLVDYIMPAASEAACNIDKLHKDGVTPQVCVDGLAQHETVVARNMDFALKWAQALLGSQPLPTCSSAGMPVCTP